MKPTQHSSSFLPLVERGCCCDLKTCCKVQGWMTLVGAVLAIFRCASEVYVLLSICYVPNEDNSEVQSCFVKEETKVLAYAIMIGNALSLVVQVVFVVTAILFIVGIDREEPKKMVHYIRFMWVQIVLVTVLIVVMAVAASPVALLAFIFLGLPFYCLVCANSLHVKMTTEQDPFKPERMHSV